MQDDSRRPLANDSPRHAEQHIHDVKLDSNGRLAVEINCADCGYNLQGADPKGCCSECGHPVAMSINISDLAYANPDWLQKLARGSGWVMFSYLLFIPSIVIASVISNTTRSSESDAYAAACLCIAPLFTALGMWSLTTPDPRQGAEDSELLRQFIRITSILSIAITLLSAPIDILWQQHRALMELVWSIMRWGALGLFLLCYCLLFNVISQHAVGMREKRIAMQCRFISLGGIVITIAGSFIVISNWAFIRQGISINLHKALFGCSFLLATPIILLWSMGLIMLYHDELSLTAKHARTLHARMSKLPSAM